MKNINKEEQLIDARVIKQMILNKSDFSDWIKRNIDKNKLIENQDYFVQNVLIKEMKNTKRSKFKYSFTEEATKKILFSQKRNKLSQELKQALIEGKSIFEIIAEINKEELWNKIRIIKINEKEYPEQLRKIKNPPKELYVKGNIENLKQHGIAVIGTRHCSNYGRKVCKLFTNNLVGYDLNIISGLAIGIDSCAHKSCIEAHGKTIAVLPSGFNNVFPKQNEGLLQEIIEKGGTVVTEYSPEYEKTQESCRQRNRIMSGLAIGTLVIEAEKRSGTTITVRNTNEQGKKAYCIPSSIYNSKGIGTNMMIKEGSAKMVTEIEDIIKDFPKLNLKRREDFEFRDLKSPAKTKKKKAKKQSIKIDEENLEVYNLLKTEPKDINEISRILNKPISEITYKLMLLEIEGAIKQLEDKRYEINNEKEEE